MNELLLALPRLTMALCLSAAVSARAENYIARWVHPADGLWDEPTHWDVRMVPDNLGNDVFDVNWDAYPVTITIDRPAGTSPPGIRHFSFASPGTLTGSGLTVGGRLDWLAGVMAGPVTTLVLGKALLHGSAPDYITLRSRTLDLNGESRLESILRLDREAGSQHCGRLNIGGMGVLEVANEAGIECGDSAESGCYTVGNNGMLRILEGDKPFLCGARIHTSWGTTEIGNRTVEFSPGVGVHVDLGSLVLRGGRIPYVPPSGASSTNGGTVLIERGTLEGNGEIGLARIGVQEGFEAVVSGRFQFDELHLGPGGTFQVRLGGRASDAYDHVAIGQKLRLGGSLEVTFTNGFENTVLPGDVFEIVTPAPGADVAGNFDNVNFGDRLPTSDGEGSFVVDHAAPGSPVIVLRDFKWVPFRLTRDDPFRLYGLHPQAQVALDGFGPVQLFPSALLTGRPGLNWESGGLTLRITDGFTAGHDVLSVQSPAVSFNGDRVVFTGPGGAVDFGSWSLAGAELSVTFGPGATTEAVQALLQGLVFFNDQYYLEAFVTGEERFDPRTMELVLTESTGHEAVRQAIVTFPHLTAIQFDPPGIRFDRNASSISEHVDLLSVFSDGRAYKLPRLEIVLSPLYTVPNGSQCPYHGSPVMFGLCLDARDHSSIRVLATNEEVIYVGQAVAGPFQTSITVKVVDMSCVFVYLTLAVPGVAAGAATGDSGYGPLPEISLPVLYALEALVKQTEEGRRLADLYWQHTKEVVTILEAQPELVSRAINLLSVFQPGLVALLSGQGNESQITPAMIAELNAAWDALMGHASPALQAALQTERARFSGFQDFADQDFLQWAGHLQIPAPDEPWIYLEPVGFAGGQFRLQAYLAEGTDVALWRSPDLVNWERVIEAVMTPASRGLVITDPSPLPTQLFYQIRPAPALAPVW